MLEFLKQIYLRFNPIINRGTCNTLDVRTKIRNGYLKVFGNNNTVKIPSSVSFNNTRISIQGDNNCLIVAEKVRFMGPCTIELKNGATVIIGENVGIRGVDFLADKAKIEIGELAMFSYGIHIRNTDSHSIFAHGEHVQTNPPADIRIGRHAWICQNSSILKGVNIGDDAIVAYGAVVTRDCPAHAVIAGNPARVVKTDIDWDY